jgi:hypothetical protein
MRAGRFFLIFPFRADDLIALCSFPTLQALISTILDNTFCQPRQIEPVAAEK